MGEMWNVILTTSFVYFLYVVLGGLMFMFLEKSDQLGLDELFKPNGTELFPEMKKILLKGNFTEDEITRILEGWKKGFSTNYFADEIVEFKDIAWTYSNAFFFSFHLCSTIGYGDVTPSTAHGEVFAVLYASIGISIHILFFKLLGDSFAQSYQEIIWRILGNEESDMKKRLGDLLFYVSWTIVLFVIPSVVFMFTEDWSFLEGVYYCFTTTSTVGLGDYVAGGSLSNHLHYTVYKLCILIWMIYGLAFFAMIVDYLSHLYQMYLLFSFNCSCRPRTCEVSRIYVDVEKLDIHFRIVRRVKHPYSMWAPRKGARKAIVFQTNQMAHLALLAERIQGELIDLLEIYVIERRELRRTRYPKKDDTVVKISKEALLEKKIPRDAFPTRKPKKEAEDHTALQANEPSNDEPVSDAASEDK